MQDRQHGAGPPSQDLGHSASVPSSSADLGSTVCRAGPCVSLKFILGGHASGCDLREFTLWKLTKDTKWAFRKGTGSQAGRHEQSQSIPRDLHPG